MTYESYLFSAFKSEDRYMDINYKIRTKLFSKEQDKKGFHSDLIHLYEFDPLNLIHLYENQRKCFDFVIPESGTFYDYSN